MQAKIEKHSVADILELKRNNMLFANSEYQRGAVWDRTRQKKLIDSLLRGYPLPIIYLHHVKKGVSKYARDDFEIIDGQQRINAIFDFAEGAFALFDPVKDADVARFPAFIKQQSCSWGGLTIQQFTQELKNTFLQTEISVAQITTDQQNEVRDLFVRLQSGLPLNHQETRDAWPGQFTDFILKIGGKPEISRYPGHPFFTSVLGMNPRTDRGKTRQLAAQLTMLFLSRRIRGLERLHDIGAEAINTFYYDHLDFDSAGQETTDFQAVLTKLQKVLSNGKRPKLKGHDAIHAVLLADALTQEYPPIWEDRFAPALDSFLAGLAKGKGIADQGGTDEYWAKYGQWTRTSSDAGAVIARRHRFYLQKMFEAMQPLSPKDPSRIFGDVERTIIYYDQEKRCLKCGGTVDWEDHEVHHVIEYSKGGPTSLSNGALVHKSCHPKGDAKVAAFAKKFADWNVKRSNSNSDIESYFGQATNADS